MSYSQHYKLRPRFSDKRRQNAVVRGIFLGVRGYRLSRVASNPVSRIQYSVRGTDHDDLRQIHF